MHGVYSVKFIKKIEVIGDLFRRDGKNETDKVQNSNSTTLKQDMQMGYCELLLRIV